jgi:hypothetical protein
LTVRQTEGDRAGESNTLSNLADLLSKLPGRLAEAKSHAEQALAIKKMLDPTAAEIWKIYAVLADIADRQGDADAARAWRREARASYAAAPVSRHMLRGQRPFIAAVVRAASDPSARPALEPVLATLVAGGLASLVGALRRILDGERDEDALCPSLDHVGSTIVAAVLRGIADPATLNEIAPAEPDGDASASAFAFASASAPATTPASASARALSRTCRSWPRSSPRPLSLSFAPSSTPCSNKCARTVGTIWPAPCAASWMGNATPTPLPPASTTRIR